MKFAKYFFASFLLLAITTAFATKSHAQTTVNKEIAWTSTAFVISDETSSSRLSNSANWTGFQTVGTQACNNSSKVCKATISYTYNTPPGDPNPSVQDVINAIANNYTPDTTPATHTGHFPTNNTFTFQVSGNSTVITVTIVEKG
jgi:hypothetical protein